MHKRALQLVLAVFIDVLLVIGDNGLGDGLSDGVDLRSVTTTSYSDSDVYTGELVDPEDKDWLIDLGVVRSMADTKSAGHLVHTLNRRISGWTRESG